jgi:hypothetical protein
MKIVHASYKDFSGPRVLGVTKYNPSATASHWERAFAVTSIVESGGYFGALALFDGTSCTGGLHQTILTYPKELASEDFRAEDDQGDLPKLLKLFEYLPNFSQYAQLTYEFKKQGWYVAQDAKIRYTIGKPTIINDKTVTVKPGDIVFGQELRNTITPLNGKVPSSGKYWLESCRWATLFHNVFAHPSTFPIQVKFGIDHSINSSRRIKLSNGLSVSQFIYGSTDSSEPFYDCPELDLAMMLFWCNSVNAPGHATKILNQTVKQIGFTGYKVGNKKDFGKVLIRNLGTSNFGRWSYTDATGRYQRTRNAIMELAKTCPLWKDEHFAILGVLPKQFR